MRTLSRGLLLSLLALTFPLSMRAYSDWLPVTPDELKMTSIAQQPGAHAVVLYHEEIDDEVKHSQSIYTRIKILTEAGKKYGNIEIPFDHRYLDINSIKGRTIQPDGTISNFEGKPFDRVLVETNGGAKYRVKAFAIPNVQVGSIVEYRYSRDYDQRIFMPPQWILQGDLFRVKQYFSYLPTKREVLMNHGVGGRGVSWSLINQNNIAPVETGLRDTIEIRLENTPAFVREPDMPPANLLHYAVYFFYTPSHGIAADFWKDEGKFWNSEVERFIGKRAGLTEAVNSVVTATDTPEQKARKIYAFVQSLQNLSYSTSRSAQEMKAEGLKEARGVQDVLRQKMGDREELARLYVAMAREANLEAYVMRVSSRNNWIFDANLLRFNQLDHEIVILKLPSGEIPLDPGVRYCPFGILYWKHSGTRGMRQNSAHGAELAGVGGGTYEQAWTRRDATLKLNSDGSLEGSLQMTYKGQRALIQRLDFWNTDEAGRKKGLEEELKHSLPENTEITLTKPPEWESDGDLVAIFQVSIPVGSTAGHRIMLPVDVFRVNHPPRYSHAERVWPVVFPYPYRATDHLHLLLPDGYEVESIPADVEQKLPYAAYHMRLGRKSNEIEVVRDEVIGDYSFSPAQYPELKAFFEKAKSGDDLQAVLKGATNAKNN